MGANVIYIEKDYTDGLRKLEDMSSEPTEEDIMMAQVMKDYHTYIESIPHLANPIFVCHFNKMVAAFDLIAREFSGRLRATVDYSHFSAKIVLECVYIEFCHGEFIEILKRIASTALRINISVLNSGFLQIEVLMPYFIPLKDNLN